MHRKLLKPIIAAFAFCSLSCACIPTDVLTPPTLDDAHVEKKISCIRPVREGTFNISTEIRNDKLLVHDYGHGGAGYALLFGSVNQSLREFDAMLEANPSFQNQPVKVIGAGCIGLLTAVRLKERGFDVSVVAKDFDHIASNYAAGTSWFVSIKIIPEFREKAQIVSADSWREHTLVLEGKHDFLSAQAAKHMAVYCGLETDSGLEPYVEDGLVQPATEVMVDFGNGKMHHMLKYTTIFINTTDMFREIQERVNALGIPVTRGTVASFDEIEESVVFNCTGIGSLKLNNDDKMIPVQGHLLMLKDQPPMDELQYMIYTEVMQNDEPKYVYYMPKSPYGVLGGTFIPGEDFSTNEADFQLMMERAQDFFGIPSN